MAVTSTHSSMASHAAVLVQLLFVLVVLSLQLPRGAESAIGVCYGMLGNNLPPPQEVIDMYKSMGITKMRLYFPESRAFAALKGSNIDVILDVPRKDLPALASDPAAAVGWIRDVVLANYPAIRFRYIAVGNEIIPGDGSNTILPAMRNVQNALVAAGVGDQIKVSTIVSMAVLGNSYPPSAGSFSGAALNYMRDIAAFLQSNGAPLMANIYPYFTYAGNPRAISAEYAMFTSLPSVVVTDGNLNYQNLFSATLDAVYASLEKVNAGNVDIIITESGWPSAGGAQASVDYARTYNNNFVQFVNSGKGTPRRPNKELEGYIFAMFNENQKQPFGIENNFGLFFPNKQPVYPMQF